MSTETQINPSAEENNGKKGSPNSAEPENENLDPRVYWKWPWHLALAFAVAAVVSASFQEVRWTHRPPPGPLETKVECRDICRNIYNQIEAVILASGGTARPDGLDDPKVAAGFRGGKSPVCPYDGSEFTLRYTKRGLVLNCPVHGDCSLRKFPRIK